MQRKLRLLATLAALAALGCAPVYPPVATFTEPADPTSPTAEETARWQAQSQGLHAAWGSIDRQYARSTVPPAEEGQAPLQLTAWRGERVSAQLLLWSKAPTEGVTCQIQDLQAREAQLPASIASLRFVRYTLSDQALQPFRKDGPTQLSPDMLDSLDRFDMDACTVRPVWLSLRIPEDAAPGRYKTQITLRHAGKGRLHLPLELEVLDQSLPPIQDRTYHLDLWQHPTAVARAQGLELWSDAHFEALRANMAPLAQAGQKVITATLNKDPWNHQCYDAYEDMIRWTRHQDGSWSYDYQVFDRWVELMLSLGVNKMINCYSMVPWNCELHYQDEAQNSQVTVIARPGTPVFEEIWTPFLKDFAAHLRNRGWLHLTNIAMDERAPKDMAAAARLLEACAPEMGFALADNHKSYQQFTRMRDVCVGQDQRVAPEDLAARRALGFSTTFYVCCGPFYPNTFTFSQPYEAELLGWFGKAWDFDGMLRWAYNSWPADPQTDARYGNWAAGDTYLVYPYGRSSIRFERLIDGMEAAEKIRILRSQGADLQEVDACLQEIRQGNINDPQAPWQEVLQRAREALDAAARK